MTRNILHDVDGLHELVDTIETLDTLDKLQASIPGEFVRKEADRVLFKTPLNSTFYYLKVWWTSGYVRFAKDSFRGGKAAVREARGMLLLNRYDLRTPRLVAYGSVFRARTSGFSYQITEEISGVETLNDCMKRDSGLLSPEAIGRTICRLHSNYLVHEDVHPENLVVSDGNVDTLYFVDCMGVGRPRLSFGIIDDLSNFFFYAEIIGWPVSFLDDILRAYCDAWPGGGKDFYSLKSAVAKIVTKRKSKFSPYHIVRRLPF
ncbi:MAG: hypothetical protein GY854_02005 [Deltaproteobacteria bacterium]|nr:hypothetical protein [Deltaproteobacteria bacterium]